MISKRKNPFTPTFGHEPFAFAGRDELIDDVIDGLANQPGDPNRATIFMGPRGSGKTVLLTTIAEEASQMGWVSAHAVARNGMLQLLMEDIFDKAGHLLPAESSSQITSIQLGPFGLSREILHETPSWKSRFGAVVEELNQQGIGVLFTIDEVDPDCEELIEFISFFQIFVTQKRDVAMLLAGLPSKVSDLLVDEHVSFIRRACQRHLKSISDEDIRDAILQTIEQNGKTIEEDALNSAVETSQGFPFAMQLVGFGAWKYAGESGCITCEHMERSIRRTAQEMEHSVILPTLRECSTREVEYLTVMAQADGPCVTSDIARKMGISMTNASNIRRRLIDRGIIIDLKMGLVEFDMPIIKTYLRDHPAEWL